MKQQTINYKLQTKNGFTLMELLLVIAIIGILSGVLMAGLGNQRQRARGSAALQSVQSAMPFIAECYLKNGTVRTPIGGSPSPANNDVCNPDNGFDYPQIGAGSTIGCHYTGGGGGGNAAITVACDAGTITCDYMGGVYCDTTF